MWFTSERAKGRTSAMRGMGRSRARSPGGGRGRCGCEAPRAAPGLGPGDAHRRPPCDYGPSSAGAGSPRRSNSRVRTPRLNARPRMSVSRDRGCSMRQLSGSTSAEKRWRSRRSVWNPAQRVSLDTLLRAYTIEGATLNHRERDTGSLEVGKAADFIILDRDLFAIPPEDIGETRVLATFVDGVQVRTAAD